MHRGRSCVPGGSRTPGRVSRSGSRAPLQLTALHGTILNRNPLLLGAGGSDGAEDGHNREKRSAVDHDSIVQLEAKYGRSSVERENDGPHDLNINIHVLFYIGT